MKNCFLLFNEYNKYRSDTMPFQSLYKIFVMNDNDTFFKIYQSRFHSEATTRFNLYNKENQFFFFFHNDIQSQITEIDNLSLKVNQIFSFLPEMAKKQYIKKSIINEIMYTNEIEGVISTRKDINNIFEDLKINIKQKNRLESIVNKYKLLMNKTIIELKNSYDLRDLFDGLLFNEIKEDNKNNLPDGEIFRKNGVYVYRNSEKVIHEGINPESKIIDYIDKSLDILNNEKINIYVRTAIFHYLFAFIHAFYDGNGRLNRFISSYVLSQKDHPILAYRLSTTIKENLSIYLDAFKHTNDARNKGDLTTFVYEFLNIIVDAYQKLELYGLEKINQINKYSIIVDGLVNKNVINKKEKKLLLYLIHCELFSEYGVSKLDLQKIMNCSHVTCINYINKLKQLSFVRENKFDKWLYFGANLEQIELTSKEKK